MAEMQLGPVQASVKTNASVQPLPTQILIVPVRVEPAILNLLKPRSGDVHSMDHVNPSRTFYNIQMISCFRRELMCGNP